MCGVFGWIGNLQPDKRLVLSTLLATYNVQRGDDSWGFATRKGDRWERHRGLGPATQVIYPMAKCHALIGHTRFATHGSVTVANAHPFEVNGMILAHNGCIYNAWDFYGTEEFEVDSELIINRLAFGNNVADLSGYGTITFVRQDVLDTVYLCNIGFGDLSVAAINNRKGKTVAIAWSSSERHLAEALETADMRWDMYKTAESTVYAATATGLYRTGETLEWSEKDDDWRNWGTRWPKDDDDPHKPPPKTLPSTNNTRLVRTKCSVWDESNRVWKDVWYYTDPRDPDNEKDTPEIVRNANARIMEYDSADERFNDKLQYE